MEPLTWEKKRVPQAFGVPSLFVLVRIILEEDVAVVLYFTLAIELVENGVAVDVANSRVLKVLLLSIGIELCNAIVLLNDLEEVYTTITLDGSAELTLFEACYSTANNGLA